MSSANPVSEIKDSPTPLMLAILSIVFGILPFIGLALATAGLITSIKSIRKVEETKDGNQLITYAPWSKVSSANKVALVLSILSILAGAFITVFGTFVVIAFFGNPDIFRFS